MADVLRGEGEVSQGRSSPKNEFIHVVYVGLAWLVMAQVQLQVI